MSLMTHELKASYAFIERNFFLSRRYWGWEIAFLVYSAPGAVAYAMVYGLIHTAAILVAMVLFFPDLSIAHANAATVGVFMVLGSFSFVGIAMMAAILPLLYVERGAQTVS